MWAATALPEIRVESSITQGSGSHGWHHSTGAARPSVRAAGPTAEVVKRAKQEIKRILEESTEKAMRREGPSVGRYSIV